MVVLLLFGEETMAASRNDAELFEVESRVSSDGEERRSGSPVLITQDDQPIPLQKTTNKRYHNKDDIVETDEEEDNGVHVKNKMITAADKARRMNDMFQFISNVLDPIACLFLFIWLISRVYVGWNTVFFRDLFQLDNVLVMTYILYYIINLLEWIIHFAFPLGTPKYFISNNILMQLCLPMWISALILSLTPIVINDESWLKFYDLFSPTFYSLNVVSGPIFLTLIVHFDQYEYTKLLNSNTKMRAFIYWAFLPTLYLMLVIIVDRGLHMPPYTYVDFSSYAAVVFILVLWFATAFSNTVIHIVSKVVRRKKNTERNQRKTCTAMCFSQYCRCLDK